MKRPVLYLIILYVITSGNSVYSQTLNTFKLPEPVLIELNRLGEAYKILDQFANEVWSGWNDYTDYPFLMTFQNGLRILIGHPAPPPEFVPYPDIKVRGLSIHIDTSELNNFRITQPLQCGGGPLTLGSFNNKPVTIVDIRFTAPVTR